MAHRPHPRGASNNAALGPWTTCDFCGFLYSHSKMRFNFQFMGGPTPMSSGFLVCAKCNDDLNYQQSLLILPPDPPVTFNTRPENYTIDETNWLVTQDGDIFETATTDEEYITSMPNPAQVANTTVIISASLQTSLSALTVAYLDLFNGDPQDGGTSILLAITGSAARTNVFSSLELNLTDGVYLNPRVITVTSAAQALANVSHVAIYDAATAGTLLASAVAGATSPLIDDSAAVQFNQLGLQVELA